MIQKPLFKYQMNGASQDEMGRARVCSRYIPVRGGMRLKASLLGRG